MLLQQCLRLRVGRLEFYTSSLVDTRTVLASEVCMDLIERVFFGKSRQPRLQHSLYGLIANDLGEIQAGQLDILPVSCMRLRRHCIDLARGCFLLQLGNSSSYSEWGVGYHLSAHGIAPSTRMTSSESKANASGCERWDSQEKRLKNASALGGTTSRWVP